MMIFLFYKNYYILYIKKLLLFPIFKNKKNKKHFQTNNKSLFFYKLLMKIKYINLIKNCISISSNFSLLLQSIKMLLIIVLYWKKMPSGL